MREREKFLICRQNILPIFSWTLFIKGLTMASVNSAHSTYLQNAIDELLFSSMYCFTRASRA